MQGGVQHASEDYASVYAIAGTSFGDDSAIFVGGNFAVADNTISCGGFARWGQTFSCPADWNQNGIVDSQDFFDFLNDFYNGMADYNGMNGTNSQDLFDFLNDFFTPCP